MIKNGSPSHQVIVIGLVTPQVAPVLVFAPWHLKFCSQLEPSCEERGNVSRLRFMKGININYMFTFKSGVSKMWQIEALRFCKEVNLSFWVQLPTLMADRRWVWHAFLGHWTFRCSADFWPGHVDFSRHVDQGSSSASSLSSQIWLA